MADITELLPCPFCGGEAEVIRKHCRVVVLCPSAGPVCLTLQSESFGNDDAIAAWNTRAAPPAMDHSEVISTLRQYINDLRYPPSADSAERRIAAAERVIAKVISASQERSQ